MTTIFKSFSFLLGAGLSVAACSATSDPAATIQASETGNRSDDVRVRPGDSENLARLTIALPTGSCLPGGTCSRPLTSGSFNLSVDGASVTLGQTLRLKPGEHSIASNGGVARVSVAAGEIRNYVLAVARSKCSPSPLPNVPFTDFGKNIAVTNVACPSKALSSIPVIANLASISPYFAGSCTSLLTKFGTPGTPCSAYSSYAVTGVRSGNDACVAVTSINAQTACENATAGNWSWIGSANSTATSTLLPTDIAFVPNTYQVTAHTTPQSFTLTEGSIAEIPVALDTVGSVPEMFATSIKFADAADLPSVGNAGQITSSCGTRGFTIASLGRATLNLRAFVDACTYTLNVAGRQLPLSQNAANAITLQRIDIDDVTVTREDGSSYLAKGTYELFFGGNRVVAPTPTNTGIDVLPGTYELVISYSTADGPKTQRQTLTL
jgi:hypothetical protein